LNILNILNDVVRILRQDGANSNWLCSNAQTTKFSAAIKADWADVIIIIIIIIIIVDKQRSHLDHHHRLVNRRRRDDGDRAAGALRTGETALHR